MTRAICMCCGAEKLGAITLCDDCGFQPRSDEQLATSMLFSTPYLPEEEMKSLSETIRQIGGPPALPPDTLNTMIAEVRKSNIRQMTGIADPERKSLLRLLWMAFSDTLDKLFSRADGGSTQPSITSYRYSMQHGITKIHLGPDEIGRSAYNELMRQGKDTVWLIHFDRPGDDGSVREVTREQWESLMEVEEDARLTGNIMQMVREGLEERNL